MDERPKVGIGVVVIRAGKVLLGKRKGAHGAGEFAGPGGHLESLESFADCAIRETLEETGIEIENVRFLCVTNLRTYAPKHYVDIGVVADWKSGEPQVLEPDKVEGWDWYNMDNLPAPLFGVEPYYIEALKTGRHYFEVDH
jgi:8-oxo-dGTP diphosphatase